jgi:hypothetical protein
MIIFVLVLPAEGYRIGGRIRSYLAAMNASLAVATDANEGDQKRSLESGSVDDERKECSSAREEFG